MKRARMTPAERFFWKHAGFCYDPKTETKAQGKRRCAEAMARAERMASNLGWSFEWQDDWMVGSHVREYGEESYPNEPSTCEACLLWDVTHDHVLASLCCIDDADASYRRVVQAELAAEALVEFEREVETLDAH